MSSHRRRNLKGGVKSRLHGGDILRVIAPRRRNLTLLPHRRRDYYKTPKIIPHRRREMNVGGQIASAGMYHIKVLVNGNGKFGLLLTNIHLNFKVNLSWHL